MLVILRHPRTRVRFDSISKRLTLKRREHLLDFAFLRNEPAKRLALRTSDSEPLVEHCNVASLSPKTSVAFVRRFAKRAPVLSYEYAPAFLGISSVSVRPGVFFSEQSFASYPRSIAHYQRMNRCVLRVTGIFYRMHPDPPVWLVEAQDYIFYLGNFAAKPRIAQTLSSERCRPQSRSATR
jgi:hypothetical protein